ncbi:MAG TPA: hypothetical protein ENJ22_00460 [Gammaproteobacteria bacterium]|nr:hypothetical protein [Gammaproteobacteria bacterium]
MSIAFYDDYLSDIENNDLTQLDQALAEAEKLEELERKSDKAARRRKAIEHYQERKRLRNDLEYFS